MTSWERYLDEGARAVAIHPDFDAINYQTCASDMIASILHAVFDSGRELDPDDPHRDTPESLLDTALRCYMADQEDRVEVA